MPEDVALTLIMPFPGGRQFLLALLEIGRRTLSVHCSIPFMGFLQRHTNTLVAAEL